VRVVATTTRLVVLTLCLLLLISGALLYRSREVGHRVCPPGYLSINGYCPRPWQGRRQFVQVEGLRDRLGGGDVGRSDTSRASSLDPGRRGRYRPRWAGRAPRL